MVRQTDGQTDGQADRWTDEEVIQIGQSVYTVDTVKKNKSVLAPLIHSIIQYFSDRTVTSHSNHVPGNHNQFQPTLCE